MRARLRPYAEVLDVPYTFKHGDRPLDGITVQRAVGRGGFGEVYYALMDSGKQVALKYLRENPEVELRGIAHVMNLKSPNLITIYDVRRNNNSDPFVIMEYVSGPSLRELMIAEPRGMGVQKAAFFLKGICRGLSYLHERGIVHRDLKPANIFYDDNYVKIGDYGLSKHMSVSQHSGQTVSVGTVHYMAPEIGSGSYTQAIDVYALGVILYEMLTGRLPYTGSSMAEILMRHLRDAPDLRDVPAPFARVIAKALEKDPKDRYQSADEMLSDVMDSADISASVDSFDATALSQVPRTPDATDPDRTVTASPRPAASPPAMDVRDLENREKLPERLQQRLDRFAQKLEKKTQKLEKRLGPRHRRNSGGGSGHRHTHQATVMLSGFGRRLGHALVLLLILAGIAVGLHLLYGSSYDDPPAGVPIAMFILGATGASLLMYFQFIRRNPASSIALHRLAYASVAGLLMLPAYLIAAKEMGDQELAAIIFGPIAALLICDWTERIEAGRRGDVSFSAALWPALVGLIASAIGGADDASLLGAGICAAFSIMTQAGAALWPGRPDTRETSILGAQHSPIAERLRNAATANTAEDGMIATEPAQSSPAGSEPEPEPDAHPSFVGRAANQGLTFVGKLLLMAGLIIVLAQTPAREAWQAQQLHIPSELHTFVSSPISPIIPICSVVLGGLLLILARRGAGLSAFLRGFIGCAFLTIGVLMPILFPDNHDALVALFAQPGEGSVRLRDEHALAFMAMGVPLGLGALLLLWPVNRNRRHKPIVV